MRTHPPLAVTDAVRDLRRDTPWTLTGTVELEGDLHHPQGMARHDGQLHISTVDIDDRSGWLHSFDTDGNLTGRTLLGRGDRFHPGGLDLTGATAIIPVAEYRPSSTTDVVAVDLTRGTVDVLFRFEDHLGACAPLPGGDIVAASWGSRHLYRLDTDGNVLDDAPNRHHHIDFQDGQLDGTDWICTGMAHLHAPGGHTELGGVGIIDTDTLTTSFEAPLHLWSPKGHTAARNPTLLRRTGTELVLEAVPDDGRAALHTWTSPLT